MMTNYIHESLIAYIVIVMLKLQVGMNLFRLHYYSTKFECIPSVAKVKESFITMIFHT